MIQRIFYLLALILIFAPMKLSISGQIKKNLDNSSYSDFSSQKSDLTLPMICVDNFDVKRWDEELKSKLNGKSLNGKTDSDDIVYFQLLRFAKPGGYKSNERNFLLMERVLSDSRLKNQFNKELSFAIQQITLDIPDLGRHFGKKADMDLPLHPIADTESCRSERERDDTRNESYAFVLKEINKYSLEKRLERIPIEIQTMIPSLLHLDEKKKKDIIVPLYRWMAAYFSEYFQGVSIAKSTVFTKKYVYDKFMKSTKGEITDVSTVFHDNGNIILMSNKQFTDIKPMFFKYGSKLAEIYFYIGFSTGINEIRWSLGKDKYDVQIKRTKIEDSFVVNSSSPDYESILKDGQLTGLVLVSSNFKERTTEHISEYLSYFEGQQFKFTELEKIDDTRNWLKEKISSGELDYVFKEAHNGGNDSSLIKIFQHSSLVVGTKDRAGFKEKIYFLKPTSKSESEHQRLSFDEMREWMHEREKNTGGPMIYVNSSCYSMSQARNEVLAIRNKLFVPIASSTINTTFSNSMDSTKRAILHGLRNRWDYETMRQKMKNTPRYKNGHNQFLFPDDNEYQNYLGKLRVLVSLEMHKNNSPDIYFIDDE